MLFFNSLIFDMENQYRTRSLLLTPLQSELLLSKNTKHSLKNFTYKKTDTNI